MVVRRAAAVVGSLLLAGAGLTGCGDEAPVSSPPAGNEVLERELTATGLQLYEIDLRGAEPERVRISGGSVSVTYLRDGYVFFVLTMAAAEIGEDPCASLRAEGNNSCEFDGELLVTSFEEMSELRLVRDGQQLIVSHLTTEVDLALEDDAAAALLDAVPVTPAAVAAY